MHPRWWANRVKSGAAGVPTPGWARLVQRWVGPFVRLAHRPTLDGAENLPSSGPFMLVANHSGSLATSEILAFATCYLERVGASRPLAAMAHPVALWLWPVSALLRGLGAIPSTYAAGESALRAGIPVLVFPGGSFEASRPVWQAYKVDFGGHQGFLKLARKLRVPVVPMGIRGSHFTAPVLWRSHAVLPRFLFTAWIAGIRQMPLTLLGVLGAVAIALLAPGLGWPLRALLIWAWLASPFPHFGWIPWKIRIRIGPPIAPEELFAESMPEQQILCAAYERVQKTVERLVDPGYSSATSR